jgi:nitroreductase
VSLATEIPVRRAQTSAPIHDVLAERWSPRSFDPDAPLDEQKLTAALEAARWAPSAGNTQPSRIIVARRGSRAFDAVTATLKGFNSVWATSAAALVVGLATAKDADGNPMRWAEYDLGQALAHLSVQAHHDGLLVHQMGGVEADGVRAAFGLDDSLVPVTIAAIGVLGSPDALPEALRERELAPRRRLPLTDLLLVNE